MSIYDDPDLKSDFFKFENVGDMIAGDLIEVRKGTDFNDKPCPELIIRTDDGADVHIGCGQAQLKAKVLAQRPEAGDWIKIEFTGTEKAAKGMKKTFELTVASGGAKGTAAVAVDDDQSAF